MKVKSESMHLKLLLTQREPFNVSQLEDSRTAHSRPWSTSHENPIGESGKPLRKQHTSHWHKHGNVGRWLRKYDATRTAILKRRYPLKPWCDKCTWVMMGVWCTFCAGVVFFYSIQFDLLYEWKSQDDADIAALEDATCGLGVTWEMQVQAELNNMEITFREENGIDPVKYEMPRYPEEVTTSWRFLLSIMVSLLMSFFLTKPLIHIFMAVIQLYDIDKCFWKAVTCNRKCNCKKLKSIVCFCLGSKARKDKTHAGDYHDFLTHRKFVLPKSYHKQALDLLHSRRRKMKVRSKPEEPEVALTDQDPLTTTTARGVPESSEVKKQERAAFGSVASNVSVEVMG